MAKRHAAREHEHLRQQVAQQATAADGGGLAKRPAYYDFVAQQAAISDGSGLAARPAYYDGYYDANARAEWAARSGRAAAEASQRNVSFRDSAAVPPGVSVFDDAWEAEEMSDPAPRAARQWVSVISQVPSPRFK